MSQKIENSADYSIVTQTQLATVLATFESSYIYSIIKDNLAMRFDNNFISIQKPNVVSALEETFINLKEIYPMDHDNIEAVRQETYEEIIKILANEYQLKLSLEYEMLNDKYPLAFYMYDLLVANFSNYITLFFSNYIFREKDALYDYFKLENYKKNKDSSTIYGKKVYGDPKIAIINANLIYILESMQAFDISMENICTVVYPDPNVTTMFNLYLIPQIDFYKTFYCEVIRNKIIAPLFYTTIRLEIQRRQEELKNE